MVSAFLVVLVLTVYIHSHEVGKHCFGKKKLIDQVHTNNACVCSVNVIYEMSPNL